MLNAAWLTAAQDKGKKCIKNIKQTWQKIVPILPDCSTTAALKNR